MQKATEEEVLIGDSYAVFDMSIKSQETLKKYKPRLRNVLKSIGLNTEQCVELGLKQPGLNQPSELQARLQKFILSKVEKYRKTGRPKPGTIRGYLKPMQRFCKMNDISNINWPKLKSFLPAETPSDDRAIRKEEIQELYKHADLRERVILTVRASSGMRIGSLPYLQFKHIQPITLEDLKRMRIDYEPQIAYGDIVAVKVTAYDTKGRKYYTTFISPEAYRDIDEYKKYRERYGEDITDESPLIRDKFDRRGIAGKGRGIGTDTMRHIMEDLIYDAGLRKRGEHKVRHEWQATHSFRKFFRTMAWQVVGADTANLLMGHSLGVDDSYLKPEHELLAEYLKIVPLVTVNQEIENTKQLKKIDELEQSKNTLQTQFETFKKQYTEDLADIKKLLKSSGERAEFLENLRVMDINEQERLHALQSHFPDEPVEKLEQLNKEDPEGATRLAAMSSEDMDALFMFKDKHKIEQAHKKLSRIMHEFPEIIQVFKTEIALAQEKWYAEWIRRGIANNMALAVDKNGAIRALAYPHDGKRIIVLNDQE